MNKIKIITDSCCSLTKEQLENLGVDFLAMDITVDGETFNSFNPPISDPEEFYLRLEKSESCSTSCINIFLFQEIFEKYVKQGYDVFYIGLSGGMSCTNNNAKVAADEINKTYGKHVWVADSLSESFAIAYDVIMAKRLADEGKSAQQIFEALDRNGLKTFAIFAPGDLKFLKRSGRISKFVASVGSMLKLVPVITANEKGELKLFSKAIGRKKALATIKTFLLENAELKSAGRIYIGHTGQKEEAEEMAAFLRANSTNKEIVIDFIDYTMGCNCGPKTLSVFGFLK